MHITAFRMGKSPAAAFRNGDARAKRGSRMPIGMRNIFRVHPDVRDQTAGTRVAAAFSNKRRCAEPWRERLQSAFTFLRHSARSSR
ncbi:hypothetical protein [Burkholderia latens]|uniref:Uncharacterized protein n=1 Tax=Burkholderia latens TaxID=488446 RepID=A0A6H9SR38_9BURK|nr:hypothetical protein [Burkholderia latens]KAB0630933.1 hypothetical protein F7R21_33175 [Burkholderia latens]